VAENEFEDDVATHETRIKAKITRSPGSLCWYLKFDGSQKLPNWVSG